jgi:hypothetical protein
MQKLKMTPEEVWEQVQGHSIGLKVHCTNPKALFDTLARLRVESGNPDLYQFTLQVKGEEVWIVRSKGLPEVKTDGAYQPLEE